MSKTYLLCLLVIALYIVVIKPLNKKEEIGMESSETITDDFVMGGFDKASHETTSTKNPVYTL